MTLRTRTGVNTGEVVAGDPSSGQALVTGDAVNMAARLEQLAGADEILIGDATHRLTANATRVEPVEPLRRAARRGRWRPGGCWRCTATIAYLRRLDTPLVGRRDELAQLRDAYARAVRQRSCALFTLVGPAGIGKSRLTLEFIGRSTMRHECCAGRCLPYGEGITFWPLAEIVRGLGGADAERTIAELMADDPDGDRVAAQVASLIGRSQTPATTDEAGWAIRRMFETIARERPLVVLLEDVNWAEPTLLELIEHIAEWSRDAPIMLLCSARDELLDMRPTWGGGLRNATTAFLEPLSEFDSAELIGHLAADQPIDETTARRLALLAGGNPLFVEQLLATIGSGTAARRDGPLHHPCGDQRAAGCAVRAGADGDRVRVGDRQGVLGRAPGRAAGRRAGSGGRHRDAARADAQGPDPPGPLGVPRRAAHRFGHLLVRDAAYARLPKRRRAELHEHLAGWIGTMQSGPDGEFSEMVGYHLEQAHRLRTELGPLDEAGRRLAIEAGRELTAAGLRAQARMDAPAAANLLGRAAALLVDDPEARREVLPELALAYAGIPDLPRARALLDELLDVAVSARDQRGEQRALLCLAHALWTSTGSGAALAHAAERAIPVFERAGDERWLVRAWLWRAFAHQGNSQYGTGGGGARAGSPPPARLRRHGGGADGVRQSGALPVDGAGAVGAGDRPLP